MERLASRLGRVLTVDADTTAREAAELLCSNHVGSLLVLSGQDVVGILTERDIVHQLSARSGADLGKTPVREVMSSNIISCDRDTTVWKAQKLMAAHGIRHLPVIEDGIPVGMVSSRDIMAYQMQATHERICRANAKIETAERTKEQFLSNINHEIRTPLNGLLGMTQLALELAVSDEQRDYLTMVRTSAETLMRVISNIVDYSELTDGQVTVKRTSFNVDALLQPVVQTFKGRAEEKALRFVRHIDPQLPRNLVGDPVRLCQVLDLLLDNAVKFTSAGSVTLRAVRETAPNRGLRVRFTVKDTGPGIPPEQHKEIFQAFRQGDGSLARRHEGSGLGLAIAAKVVRQLGGSLWLDSEPDRGSAFHFAVPFDLPGAEASGREGSGIRASGLGTTSEH